MMSPVEARRSDNGTWTLRFSCANEVIHWQHTHLQALKPRLLRKLHRKPLSLLRVSMLPASKRPNVRTEGVWRGRRASATARLRATRSGHPHPAAAEALFQYGVANPPAPKFARALRTSRSEPESRRAPESRDLENDSG